MIGLESSSVGFTCDIGMACGRRGRQCFSGSFVGGQICSPGMKSKRHAVLELG